jgi:hypothetical protein
VGEDTAGCEDREVWGYGEDNAKTGEALVELQWSCRWRGGPFVVGAVPVSNVWRPTEQARQRLVRK